MQVDLRITLGAMHGCGRSIVNHGGSKEFVFVLLFRGWEFAAGHLLQHPPHKTAAYKEKSRQD
jgi:hypothetical protein